MRTNGAHRHRTLLQGRLAEVLRLHNDNRLARRAFSSITREGDGVSKRQMVWEGTHRAVSASVDGKGVAFFLNSGSAGAWEEILHMGEYSKYSRAILKGWRKPWFPFRRRSIERAAADAVELGRKADAVESRRLANIVDHTERLNGICEVHQIVGEL